MKLPIFKLEEYFNNREFISEYLFSSSDMESYSVRNLLELDSTKNFEKFLDLKLNYIEPKGSSFLIDEILKEYPKFNKDNIHCFSGAEEGIYSFFKSNFNTQDHFIIITPCYQSLLDIPKSMGCKISKINLENKNRNWIIDIDKIKKEIKKNTKCIVLNNPHNPTGALISKDEQYELIEISRKNGIIIFSDEVYRGLEHNLEHQLLPFSIAYENAVSLSVMSKSYGLAGLRIGWLSSQNLKLIKNAALYKHYLSICNSSVSEFLATIALQNKEYILKNNRNILLNNLKLIKNFIDNYQNKIQWNIPKGGCIAFPKILLNINIDKFADELLKKHKVLILPGSVFSVKGSFFRIGYGRKNFPEALEHFKSFLDKF